MDSDASIASTDIIMAIVISVTVKVNIRGISRNLVPWYKMLYNMVVYSILISSVM